MWNVSDSATPNFHFPVQTLHLKLVNIRLPLATIPREVIWPNTEPSFRVFHPGYRISVPPSFQERVHCSFFLTTHFLYCREGCYGVFFFLVFNLNHGKTIYVFVGKRLVRSTFCRYKDYCGHNISLNMLKITYSFLECVGEIHIFRHDISKNHTLHYLLSS